MCYTNQISKHTPIEDNTELRWQLVCTELRKLTKEYSKYMQPKNLSLLAELARVAGCSVNFLKLFLFSPQFDSKQCNTDHLHEIEWKKPVITVPMTESPDNMESMYDEWGNLKSDTSFQKIIGSLLYNPYLRRNRKKERSMWKKFIKSLIRFYIKIVTNNFTEKKSKKVHFKGFNLLDYDYVNSIRVQEGATASNLIFKAADMYHTRTSKVKTNKPTAFRRRRKNPEHKRLIPSVSDGRYADDNLMSDWYNTNPDYRPELFTNMVKWKN